MIKWNTQMIVNGTFILTRKKVLGRDGTAPDALGAQLGCFALDTSRPRPGSCRSPILGPPTRRHHERHLLVFRAPPLTPAPTSVSAGTGDRHSVRVGPCYTHGKRRAQPEPDVERRRPDPVPDRSEEHTSELQSRVV